MRPVLLAALLGACAPPRAAEPEPAGVAAVTTGDTREVPEEPEPASYAERLAARLRTLRLGVADWPRRNALPKPLGFYDAAFLWSDGACDGWQYEVLVDLDQPRIFWVRRSGSIMGTVEYLGPAEIVDDSGPLEVRIVK